MYFKVPGRPAKKIVIKITTKAKLGVKCSIPFISTRDLVWYLRYKQSTKKNIKADKKA